MLTGRFEIEPDERGRKNVNDAAMPIPSQGVAASSMLWMPGRGASCPRLRRIRCSQSDIRVDRAGAKHEPPIRRVERLPVR